VILEIGAVGEVMRKPFSLTALRTNIEKALRGRIYSTKTEHAMDQPALVRLPRAAPSDSA
jgi:hypothetical protein